MDTTHAFVTPQETRNMRVLDGVREDRRNDPVVAAREARAVAGRE